MNLPAAALSTSRREFLAVTGGLALAGLPIAAGTDASARLFEPIRLPDWVLGVTRMAFLTPGQVEEAARLGVQVVHGNAVWPYFPLRRDGGGLAEADAKLLRSFVDECHRHHLKLVLGLPPFPPVALVKQHPDWRVHPDDSDKTLRLIPDEKDLGTRLGCNLGPWGAYLIDVCAELVQDFDLDGFSFDGNYHPPLCFCPACKTAYRSDAGRALPARAHLDDIAYREYLVWRGQRLEDHYRLLQGRIKKLKPDAVLMSWTVNAGRYGHFLQSPRAMPTRLNLLFDLPMQEWWLDETNFGASVTPAFGAAYVGATVGHRPNASEPYLMARGNPYGTDSFPAHERLTRSLLALTNGSLPPQSLGWPGHRDSATATMRAIAARERWIVRTTPMPWAALLISEQTRQFHAYQDIAARYLPHVFGVFRAALEEHLRLDLVNDWDLEPATLAKYRVLVLANAAALSDAQAEAVRQYVRGGGGLVATAETSLCDDLGRPRRDFALADLFGVSYQGGPQRSGVVRLTWTDHPLTHDARLDALVPNHAATFRGPWVNIAPPQVAAEVVARMTPEGGIQPPLPAIVARSYGTGRVVYLAASVDAALWSYAYPYQRRLLTRALEWAAATPFPVSVFAPMCVQVTCFEQADQDGRRVVIHLFNGLNTTANHGLPAMDVPLREETLPIHDIHVRFERDAPHSFHVEPGGLVPTVRREGAAVVVAMPPLTVHSMLVGEHR